VAGKRSKYKVARTISLPTELLKALEERAKTSGSDVSNVIREELSKQYGMKFDNRGKKI